MKKISALVSTLLILVMGLVFVIPTNAVTTVNFKNFKRTYRGTFKQTYTNCGTLAPQAKMTIKIKSYTKKSARKANITKAYVWQEGVGSENDFMYTGRFYGATVNKKKVEKLRLDYTGNTADNTYYLTGTVTRHTLKGKFFNDAYVQWAGQTCQWGGTYTLTAK